MEWLCGDRPASRLLSSGSVSCDYFFARVSLVCFFVIRTLVRMLALSAAPVRIEASTACPQLAVGATLHPSHREPSQKSSRASGARRSWPGSLAVGRVHGTQKRARASASRSRGRVECPLGPRAPYRGRSPRVPENPKTHHRWLARSFALPLRCGATDPSTSRFHGRRRPPQPRSWMGWWWVGKREVRPYYTYAKFSDYEERERRTRRRSTVDDACSPI